MKASETVPSGRLAARFLRAVEAWCARSGMSAGAFGAAAFGDCGFVASVRNGRNLRLGTVDRALAVMGAPPAGRAFRREVEAFLAVTGVKRSWFGQEATGNPSFVAHLLGGVSPTLATVEAVRAAMRSLASPAELHEVRARAGAMPALLTGAPWPRPALPRRPAEEPARPARGGERGYVDTREAAARLGLSPATLARWRIAGEGPWFHRFGGCVRYRRDHLEAWAAERRISP